LPICDSFGWEDTFVFEARSSKVEEEADGGLGGGEVGNDLGEFFVAEITGEGFVFDHDAVVDPVIEIEVAEPLIFGVIDLDGVFFDAAESDAVEFAGEGALVVFFAQSAWGVAVDAHGGSDDLIGEVLVGNGHGFGRSVFWTSLPRNSVGVGGGTGGSG
jgi:hypothetical protein